MIFFDYCFFRMYKAYEAKNDSPFLRSLIYVSILELFIFVIAYLFIKEVLARLSVIEGLDFERPLYVWSIAGLLLIGSFVYYARVSITELEKRFGNKSDLNRSVQLWMLILLPFFILLGGIIAYICAFGGVIFGKSIDGIF